MSRFTQMNSVETLPSYLFDINFSTIFSSAPENSGYPLFRQNVQSPTVVVLPIEIFPLVLPEEGHIESSQKAISLQFRFQLLISTVLCNCAIWFCEFGTLCFMLSNLKTNKEMPCCTLRVMRSGLVIIKSAYFE